MKMRLFLLLAVSILPVLGLAKISGSSEAREAHVAQVIINSSEWILPDRNGFVPSKPILHHWLIAAFSFVTAAVDEFSARLPSAVLGIVLVVLLYSFTQKLFSDLQVSDSSLPLLSALVLCSSYGFFRMLFSSMVDLSFAFFCCLAILSGIRPIIFALVGGQAFRSIKNSEWSSFFLLSALATLAKGPLGLALPCLFVGVFYSSNFGLKVALKDCLRPKLAWLVFVVITSPWYYLAYAKSQAAFLERQLFFENFQRFFGGDNVNSEPFWFYIPSFLSRMAPWSFVILVGLFLFLRAKKDLEQPQVRIIKSLSCSLLACLTLFSLSSGKRHSYLLPLFPIFSLLLVLLINFIRSTELSLSKSRVILRIESYLRSPNFVWHCFGLARMLGIFVFSGFSVMAVCFLIFKFKNPELQISANYVLNNLPQLTLAPLLALSCLYFSRRAKRDLLLSSLFVFSASFSTLLSCIYGIKGEFRDYPQMAADILKQSQSRQIVAIRSKYDELLDPIFFYLGKPVKVYAEDSLGSICDLDNSLIIGRRQVLLPLTEMPSVREEAIYRELVGKPTSIESRAITAISCLSNAQISEAKF